VLDFTPLSLTAKADVIVKIEAILDIDNPQYKSMGFSQLQFEFLLTC